MNRVLHFTCLQGILHFSKSDQELTLFVPRISPLILIMVLRSSTVVVSEVVDELILQLFDLEANFHAVLLEKFHAKYETIRSHLLHWLGIHSMTIGKLYPKVRVPEHSKHILNIEVPIVPRQYLEINTHYKLMKSSAHSYGSNVVLPGIGNPGFDIVIPITVQRKPSYFLIETRYSAARGKSTLQQVQHKRKIIDDRLEALPLGTASSSGLAFSTIDFIVIVLRVLYFSKSPGVVFSLDGFASCGLAFGRRV
jgi:hypothetical protein